MSTTAWIVLHVFTIAAACVAAITAHSVGRTIERAQWSDERVKYERELASLRAQLEQMRASAGRWKRFATKINDDLLRAVAAQRITADRPGPDDADEPMTVSQADRLAAAQLRREHDEEVIRRNPFADLEPRTINDPEAMPVPVLTVAEDESE